MRYIKDLQPYNKFWGNCIVNMFLSILTKVDVSYEPLAYLNYYEYSYYPDNVFHLDYTQEYYDFFANNIFKYESFNFKNKENFIQEFKAVLMNNLYATLNVDLYYWNSTGYYFNKIHTSHFAFVTGFDEEKDVFYAFEDDVNLFYNIRAISTNEVIQAFHSPLKQIKSDYRILTFKTDSIPSYEIDINQFTKCTEQLIYNLDMLIERHEVVNKTMIIEDASKIYHYNYEFSKISNRLKGNKLLLCYLKDKGLLDERLTEELSEVIDESCITWKNIQGIYLKHCLRKNFAELNRIEDKIADAFMTEKEVWEKVIENIKMS
ncbi:hypothetical protein [Ruminiclostridium josui]|uniref:hypothetical protein n=1 Tax=Ruminiclostridium josui TaxID=1499 RepID=UPI0004642D47|nr:hypothetical protein [Ruminiclostridium josui]